MKMLITQALDKRDFLKKKIAEAIDEANFAAAKRHKDSVIPNLRMTEDEFKKQAVSAYQSITDMIDQLSRINQAITLSNATTTITVCGQEMTVAEAISKKQNMAATPAWFEHQLQNKMSMCYNRMVNANSDYDRKADEQAVSLTATLAGRENKKLSDEDLAVVTRMTEDLRGVNIDPLNLSEKIADLNNKHSMFAEEIESAIKVSNATTVVEI